MHDPARLALVFHRAIELKMHDAKRRNNDGQGWRLSWCGVSSIERGVRVPMIVPHAMRGGRAVGEPCRLASRKRAAYRGEGGT